MALETTALMSISSSQQMQHSMVGNHQSLAHCMHCPKVFSEEKYLLQHVSKHHSQTQSGAEELKQQAIGIGSGGGGAKNVNLLIQQGKSGTHFKCNFCERVFAQLKSIKIHAIRAHGVFVEQLADNGQQLYTLVSASGLAEDEKPGFSAQALTFNCQSCKRTFATERALKIHVNKSHIDPGIELAMGLTAAETLSAENLSATETPPSLKADLDKTQGIEGGYGCDLCGRCFPTEKQTKIHRYKMHIEGANRDRDLQGASVGNAQTRQFLNLPDSTAKPLRQSQPTPIRVLPNTVSDIPDSPVFNTPIMLNTPVAADLSDVSMPQESEEYDLAMKSPSENADIDLNCRHCGQQCSSAWDKGVHEWECRNQEDEDGPLCIDMQDQEGNNEDDLDESNADELNLSIALSNEEDNSTNHSDDGSDVSSQLLALTTNSSGLVAADERGEYVCTTCGRNFPTEKALKIHRYKIHPNDWKEDHQKEVARFLFRGDHGCKQCGRTFATSKSLKIHIFKAHIQFASAIIGADNGVVASSPTVVSSADVQSVSSSVPTTPHPQAQSQVTSSAAQLQQKQPRLILPASSVPRSYVPLNSGATTMMSAAQINDSFNSIRLPSLDSDAINDTDDTTDVAGNGTSVKDTSFENGSTNGIGTASEISVAALSALKSPPRRSSPQAVAQPPSNIYPCKKCGKQFFHRSNMYRHMKLYCKGAEAEAALAAAVEKNRQQVCNQKRVDLAAAPTRSSLVTEPSAESNEQPLDLRSSASTSSPNHDNVTALAQAASIIGAFNRFPQNNAMANYCRLCNKYFHDARAKKIHVTRMHSDGLNSNSESVADSTDNDLKVGMFSHFNINLWQQPLKFLEQFNSAISQNGKQVAKIDKKDCAVNVQRSTLSPSVGLILSSETASPKPAVNSILDPQLYCPVCGKFFSHRSVLQRHIRVHRFGKAFACNVCHKAFTRKFNLMLHKKLNCTRIVHLPTTCSVATYVDKPTTESTPTTSPEVNDESGTTTASSSSSTTTNTTTNEVPNKRYSCAGCGEGFALASVMYAHRRHCSIAAACRRKNGLQLQGGIARSVSVLRGSAAGEHAATSGPGSTKWAVRSRARFRTFKEVRAAAARIEAAVAKAEDNHKRNQELIEEDQPAELKLGYSMCTNCNKYFKDSMLPKHVLYFCKGAQATGSSLLDLMASSLDVSEEYSCADCGLKFTSDSALIVHRFTKHTTHFMSPVDGEESATLDNGQQQHSLVIAEDDNQLDDCSIDVSPLQQLRPISDEEDAVDTSIPRDMIRFICKFCDKEFPHRLSLTGHMKTHLTDGNKKHHCDLCLRRFTTKNNLRFHKAKFCKGASAAQLLAGKSSGLTPLMPRITSSSETTTTSSDISVSRIVQIKQQVIAESNREDAALSKLKCSQCVNLFDDFASLHAHVLKEHTKFSVDLPATQKTSNSNDNVLNSRVATTVTSSLDAAMSGGGIQCPHCPRRFHSPVAVKIHGYRVHNVSLTNNELVMVMDDVDGGSASASPGAYICSVCRKVFGTSTSLNSHKLTHHESSDNKNKPFQCDDCKKRFSSKSALMTHQTWRCPSLAEQPDEDGPPRKVARRRAERIHVKSGEHEDEDNEDEIAADHDRGKLVIKINMNALHSSGAAEEEELDTEGAEETDEEELDHVLM